MLYKTTALYGCPQSDELSIPEVCKASVGTHLEEPLRRELGHQMGAGPLRYHPTQRF